MKTIAVFILFCVTIFAQIQPNVPDFLISGEDNSPSTLKQASPILTKTNSNNFTVTWSDRRDGSSHYTQKFDGSGYKIGKNLKTDGSLAFSSPDNSLLTLKTSVSPFFDNTYYSVYAKLYSPANKEIQNTQLDGGYNIWCAFGYIPGEELVAASQNSFLYLSNEGGSIKSLRIKNDGTISSTESNLVQGIARTALCTNSKSDMIYVWLSTTDIIADNWKTKVENTNESISPGLYITVINSEDSLLVPYQLVQDIKYTFFSEDIANYKLNIIALNDSLYKIFWIKTSTVKLFSKVFNLNTQSFSDTDSLIVADGAEGYELRNLLVTNKTDQGFYVKLMNKGDNVIGKQYLIKYDADGSIIGNILSKNELYTNCNNEFYSADGFLYSATECNGDIYLVKKNNLDSLSAQMINDDESGSEEKNIALSVTNDNTVLSAWNDGKNYYGTTINASGVVGKEIPLEESSFKYFNDGRILAPWVKKFEASYSAGYSIYDNSFNKLLSKTLAESAYMDNLSISAEIISDTTFLIFLGNEKNYSLVKEGISGTTIKTEAVFTEQNFYIKKIYNDEDGFVWVQGDRDLRKYDYNLEKLDYLNLRYNYSLTYIGSNRFLITNTEYELPYLNRVEGTIVDAAGDTLKSQIIFGYCWYSNYNFSIERLNNGRFVFINKYNNTYIGRTYNNDGVAYADSFKINHSSENEISDIRCIQKGSKVYFTWSEARTPGKSLDIYGSIFDVDKITAVNGTISEIPTSYKLEQNYPNPFNPATNFVYNVAEPGLVTIKVYDLLGNEIATLINEEKPAGQFQVSFDGSNLASGTYFYRLVVNSYTETRKMMLVK